MLSSEQLFWCKEWCAAMADKITDFVYADDSKETIDVINVLLLGWILLGLVVYVLGNVIAAHWRRNKKAGAPKRTVAGTPSEDDDVPTPPAAAEGEQCELAAAPPRPSDEGAPVSPEEEEGPLVVEGGELCEWVCAVLGWVRRERVVSPLADAWTDALNASARIAATEHGLLVDFRDVLSTSLPPKVAAIRVIDGEQAVECDVELRGGASFGLGVWRQGEGGGRLPPLPYVLHLHTLTGKVWVECRPRDVSFVARFLEPPEMELSVEPSNNIQDVDALCDAVGAVCRDALRTACVRLRLACFPECPRPTHLTPTVEGEGRELLVKVVKAENLSEGVLRSFCVLEVDDPPQRHSTPTAQGSDPYFDKQFTISVKDSAELLFEVYDQEKANSVLGLCMVEVGELLRHPRQRQVVPLASMNHDAPPSDATLTLEFVFPERVETNSRVTAQGTLITTTTIQRTHQECSLVPLETMPNAKANPNPSLHATEEMLHPETPSDHLHEKCSPSDGLDETAPNTLSALSDLLVEQPAAPNDVDIESQTQTSRPVVEPLPLGQSVAQKQPDSRGGPPSGEPSPEPQNRHRVGVHAPNGHLITQVQGLKSDLHVEGMAIPFENGSAKSDSNGTEKRGSQGRKSAPIIKPPPAILVSETGEDAPLSVDGECVAGRALAQLGASPSGTSRSTLIIHSVHRPESSSPESPEPPHQQAEGERSGRKGGVLGALRRRLSLRSRSSERSNPASPRRTLGSSTRSSLSEASGVSAATFVHENSTLVVETNENGIVRRYLVPGGGRSMKQPRGTKLHIFNDHVFVARHLTGSVPCCVCGRHLTRRPGKQGYECRGCSVRCHKSCHVRVADFCPNSAVNAMEVEYLAKGGASPKSI